jgi:hypothetical protein
MPLCLYCNINFTNLKAHLERKTHLEGLTNQAFHDLIYKYQYKNDNQNDEIKKVSELEILTYENKDTNNFKEEEKDYIGSDDMLGYLRLKTDGVREYIRNVYCNQSYPQNYTFYPKNKKEQLFWTKTSNGKQLEHGLFLYDYIYCEYIKNMEESFEYISENISDKELIDLKLHLGNKKNILLKIKIMALSLDNEIHSKPNWF